MARAMNRKAQAADSGACDRGCGLPYELCCGLREVRLPKPDEAAAFGPQLKRARRLVGAGDDQAARTILCEILRRMPGHGEALAQLAALHQRGGNLAAAEKLLERLVRIRPNDPEAACDLAMVLFRRGGAQQAFKHARNALRLAPRHAQAHNLLGMVLTELNQAPAGEIHYRRALELHGPVGKLCANLGLNLKKQGKVEEAEAFYRQAMELEPDNVESLLGWVRLEEARARVGRAESLLQEAARKAPRHPALPVTRSVIHRRARQLPEALASLDAIDVSDKRPQQLIGWNYERGLVLDRMGRYDEAFAAFRAANRAIRDSGLRDYGEDQARQLADRLKRFFTRERLALLPRATPPEAGRPRPIFVVGFPRSGTTMVEQILTSHPSINAGDELHFIWDLSRVGPQMLGSDLAYPECLIDLLLGTNRGALDNFRDFYLKRAQLIEAADPALPWFTDKMPLNETHLGLIHLVFPESPIIHLIRHPLDVILSCYFNDLTHGFNMAYGLESAAHHYVLIRELVDHYREQMDLRYLPIRYEDLVGDIETHARRLLEFVGEDWDPRCIEFHKNRRYARTASYQQVTEKLYDSSVYRYRHYRKHLDGILPVLEPIIERLGYAVD